MLVENSTELLAQTVLPVREPRMAWGKNNPVGEAKGIYPGRVVWTHAPGAATWEKGDGFWFEDRWNNQADADWLLNQSLLSLTGEKKEKVAWKSLFFISISSMVEESVDIRKEKGLLSRLIRIILSPMKIVNS